LRLLQEIAIFAAIPTLSRKAIDHSCPYPITAPNDATVRWQHTSVYGRRHTVRCCLNISMSLLSVVLTGSTIRPAMDRYGRVPNKSRSYSHGGLSSVDATQHGARTMATSANSSSL